MVKIQVIVDENEGWAAGKTSAEVHERVFTLLADADLDVATVEIKS